jgi:class 3 adenylate cyclase
VLIISAVDEVAGIARCITLGAEDYLPKPCNPVLLRARVRACLAKKQLQDQEAAAHAQMQAFNAELTQRVQEATTQLQADAQLLARRLRAMEALSAVALALSATMDVDRVLELIMDTSKDVMQAEASSLLLFESATQTLRFQVARGTAEAALRAATVALGQGIAGVVAQTGVPLLIPDAYADPRFDPSYDRRSGFRTRSLLTVPLHAQDTLLGVVQVVNKRGEAPFDAQDLALFQAFASQASVALENARLYERTRAMAAELREALEHERRLAIEKAKMGAYIPKQVVDAIARDREQTLALGGKAEHVTILFADIVGFTRLAEALVPEAVVSFLNVYMTAMTAVITAGDGILDKFIGDGIMAIFTAAGAGAPHAVRAVWAGLRMQATLADLRQQWAASRPELVGLQIRVGINTGEVVAGNVGAETRMDYTVIGDNVNVAARIEVACRPGEVCISAATYQAVQTWVEATPLAPVLVKNRVQPVSMYVVHHVRMPGESGATWEA